VKIGDKVKILECHKMPALVGKIAKVVTMNDPETNKYPIEVKLVEPIEQEVEVGTLAISGPFGFREDELELADPNHGVPDAFTKE